MLDIIRSAYPPEISKNPIAHISMMVSPSSSTPITFALTTLIIVNRPSP